jgi:imidazolonepropionase
MPSYDLVLTNAHLATMRGDEPYGMMHHGAIAIKDGRMAWVGPANAVSANSADHVVDLGGRWVTPGLIDCHTHIVYAGNRAHEFEMRLQGATYETIARSGGGIRSTMAATRSADEQALFDAAAPRIRRLLQEGVTTIEIKSGYGLDDVTEQRMLRVARRLGEVLPVHVVTSYLGAHTVPPEFAGQADAYVALMCETVLPQIAAAGLADAVDVCYEPIGFTRAQAEAVLRAAQRFNLPVKLHTGQFAAQGGGELAAAYEALSADHLEFCSDADIAAMRAAGTVAVLLPGASYFLRMQQLPPVERMRAQGLAMAISTDSNPGSSPVTSLLLMLNMACTRFGLTPEEALAGVTRHAAQALGLADTIGTLEVGKRADLAVWDIDHPVELSYALGANPCRGVVRDGEMILAQGIKRPPLP